MRTVLYGLRLLALTVWVGGLVFFAFVVAPVAFTHLPSAHEAGLVVGASLRVLHWMGLAAGAVFLVLSVPGRGARAVGAVAVLGMLGLTAVSQFGVLPRMKRDRVAAGGDVQAAHAVGGEAAGAAADFDRLHVASERMEGGVLLLGLVALGSLAVERQRSA